MSFPLMSCAAACVAVLMSLSMTSGSPPERSDDSFSLVVMDPLAAPLSCECVEGYAQRRYEELGKSLETTLGEPVTVVFAESLGKALKKDAIDHADLIIGKDSVVRADGPKSGYSLTALARLTDQKGHVTQTGLVVVRSADNAQALPDLAGYRILFGPQDCQEKFAAPRKLLEGAGVELPPHDKTEVSLACSDGACKIIEWGDTQRAAAVISSYAAPLLEGCGTIDKGDLRVVGETAPVPFITAFATDRLSAEKVKVVQQTLLSASENPELLLALESMLGFIEPEDAYVRQYGLNVKAKRPVKPQSEPQAQAKAPKTYKTSAWNGFMGPDRNGRVAWLPQALREAPTVAWRQPLLFPGMGGLAATDQCVILGDRDPTNSMDVWRCYAAESGERLWEVEYPAFGSLDYDNLPRATPVIDGDRVFLYGAFGDLVCADLTSGQIVWQVNVRVLFGADYELVWGTCSTPLVTGGRVIVNPGGPDASLAALDAATGDIVWQSPGDRHAYASLILATLGGVQQVVTYDRHSLGGWDPATGDRLWTLKPPVEGDFNVPTPVVVDGKLLVVSENNGARLHAFDDHGVINPEPEAWYSRLKPDMSTPVVAGGRVFCVRDQLYCLDASTLKPAWVGGRREFTSYASLIATEDRLLAVSRGGDLLLIDVAADEYQVVSRWTPFPGNQGAELYGCPAVVGDRLYLRGEEELVCVLLEEEL